MYVFDRLYHSVQCSLAMWSDFLQNLPLRVAPTVFIRGFWKRDKHYFIFITQLLSILLFVSTSKTRGTREITDEYNFSLLFYHKYKYIYQVRKGGGKDLRERQLQLYDKYVIRSEMEVFTALAEQQDPNR